MFKLTIISLLLLSALIWYLNCDAETWIERTRPRAPQVEKTPLAENDAAEFCPIARMIGARSHKRVQIAGLPENVQTVRSPEKVQIARSRKSVRVARLHRRVQLAKSHTRTRIAKSRATRGDGSKITGIASWYGGEFLGRTTASGATFVAHKMTAAHKHLPFGTKLLVRNSRNGRTAIVTINDRGPFIKDRVLDLSPAAAKKLGMVSSGITPIVASVVNDS